MAGLRMLEASILKTQERVRPSRTDLAVTLFTDGVWRPAAGRYLYLPPPPTPRMMRASVLPSSNQW